MTPSFPTRRSSGLLEEPRRPAADVGVEEVALLGKVRRCAEAAGDEAGHHLAERGDMIFRLFHVVGARNAQARHVAAQPRQRLLVQKAGEIVGSVGQQLALPDAGEEVEMLLARRLDGGAARRGGQRSEEHTSELQSLMRTSYAVFC